MLPRHRSVNRPHLRDRAKRAGLTLVELVIAAGIIAVLLLLRGRLFQGERPRSARAPLG